MPRLAKQYNNKQITDIVGGVQYNFRSKIEYRIAQYLELLKTAGEIKSWKYETHQFVFPDDTWLVDFVVRNNDNTFWYLECKGRFEVRDRKKLQLVSKYYPEAVIVMCFYSKRDAARLITSKKYVDKVWVLSANGVNTIWDKSLTALAGQKEK